MARKRIPCYPLVGAHISIAGGVETAPLLGAETGCVTIQIFTKSSRQWNARALTDDAVAAFKRNCEAARIAPVIGHTGYLINLAARDRENHAKSMKSFQDELERSEQLGLPGLVVHPGSHGDAGETAGLRKIIDSINKLIERTADAKVKILLETAAGQGTSVGYRFEHIAEIIAGVKNQSRVDVCFDTCHAFAAGYDIRTQDEWQRTIEEFDRIIGIKRLAVFHFNDSKTPFASRVDRHEHIGQGHIGKPPFGFILRDPRFKEIPKLLETPKGIKGKTNWDVLNLRLLRKLSGYGAPCPVNP